MKEKIIFFIFALIIISPFVISQNQTNYEKAYECLENKVKTHCSSLSPEEQAFSLLALSYNSNIQSECKDALLSSSKNRECWPSSSCDVKTTSLALLALSNIKQNTTKIENWLISHKIKTKDIDWYLEIDSSQQTQCKISYDNTDYKININEDKKISGDAGPCLSLAYNNYWLKIKENCLEKNFTISCDKDFISTIIYKKRGSDVWYVSSNVESAQANGNTYHYINSNCLSNDNTNCNYEGTLWGVLALQKVGYDIKEFLPYIISFESDNKKYLPSSFIYYLTNSPDYLSKVLEEQNSKGYWSVSGNKFYDSAVALLSVSSASPASFNLAQSWIFSNQDSEGCLNSNYKIRDTAFILWAGWPRAPTIKQEIEVIYCENMGYYCISRGACEEAEGKILDNYYCSGMNVCCSKKPQEKTCEEMGGVICKRGEKCSVSTVQILGEECCIGGRCIAEEEKTECEFAGYVCRDKCLRNEEEINYECKGGNVCCKEKEEVEKSKAPIIILLVLIFLVIILILLRNRIKILLFKRKNKFKKGPPVMPPKPPFPPMTPPPTYPPTPRFIPPRQNINISHKDREFDETMKKLREMSK